MTQKEDRAKVRADRIHLCAQKLPSEEVDEYFKWKYLELERHSCDLEIDAVLILNSKDIENIKQAIREGKFVIKYFKLEHPDDIDYSSEKCLLNLFGGRYKFQKEIDTNEGILTNEEQDLDIIFPLRYLPSGLLEQDETETCYYKTLRKGMCTHVLYKIKK